MKNIIALPVVLAFVLAAPKCSANDSNPPTVVNPQGETITPLTNLCNIDQRQINSNGIWYVHFTCNDGTDGSEVLAGPDAYPSCVVNTYYPECKEA